MIQQPLDCFVAEDRFFHDIFTVFRLHFDVLDDLVTLLNTDQGAQFAEALAAGLLDTDGLFFVITAAGV